MLIGEKPESENTAALCESQQTLYSLIAISILPYHKDKAKQGREVMPIDVKDFDEKGTEPAGKQSGQVRPLVEKFLADNDGQAYTTREIADATKANKATVNHTVRKLQEEGKVERKSVDSHIYNRWVGGELSEEEDEEEEE